MRMLDPKMYLHGNSKSLFTWTQVLEDEATPVSYVGFVNQDDVLLVRSTVDGDETNTLFACFRGYADQISNIWALRVAQVYVRFDLLRASLPTIRSFYEPYDSSTGGPVFGGSTQNPTGIDKENIQIVGGALSGVDPYRTGKDVSEQELLSTLTTPIDTRIKATVGVDLVFPLGASRTVLVHVLSSDELIFTLSLFYFNTDANFYIQIKDQAGAVKAQCYAGPVLNAGVGTFVFDINLATKLLQVSCPEFNLDVEECTDIDISNEGLMEETNVGEICGSIFAATNLVDTSGQKITSLQAG